jgi:hypothetical protein
MGKKKSLQQTAGYSYAKKKKKERKRKKPLRLE